MNLFIVESPFQLLCAIEARNSLKEQKSLLIVKLTRTRANNNQMRSILEKYRFDRVIIVPFIFALTISDFTLLSLYFWWNLRKYSFHNIFLGEAKNTVIRSAALNLSYEEYFFLDDGISTIAIQNNLNQGISMKSQSVENLFIAKARNAFASILNLKLNKELRVNWFTCFNIEVEKDQKIIKHDFDSLKYSKSDFNGEQNQRVHFVGSPISEDGKLRMVDEVYLIARIAEGYRKKGKELQYCNHRRESKQKIELTAELPNVRIRTARFPLEIDFLLNNEPVLEIGSFMSTTLFTLPLILDIPKPLFFEIEEKYWKQSFYPTYLLTKSKYVDSGNIEVVPHKA